MGIRDSFDRWTLGRQLKVLFITAGFFICLVLVVITKFQLDWLRELVTSEAQSVVQERVLLQMQALSRVEARYLTSELSNYLAFVSFQKEIDEILNNFTKVYSENPFNSTTFYTYSDVNDIVNNDAVYNELNYYNYSVYYSKYGTSSEEIQKIASIESCFKYFYPSLYQSELIEYHQGYANREMFVYYPPYEIITSYTPIVTEWYHSALLTPSLTVLTEPFPTSYIDWNTDLYVFEWSISISKAILNNTQVYGVAGLEVSLTPLTQQLSNLSVLNTGFILLVSAAGTVLTVPNTWQQSAGNTTIQINDTGYTGITPQQWSLIQNSSDNSNFTFTDPNATEYLIVKQTISPLFESKNVSYYLLLCVEMNEINKTSQWIDSSFSETYNLLFWLTLAFGIFVFTLIVVMSDKVSRGAAKQLKMVEKVFEKIVKKGLLPRSTKGMSFKKLENNQDGIETLVMACKFKFMEYEEREKSFEGKRLGSTRPGDCLLYDEWRNEIYPFNYHLDKSMKWREALIKMMKALR